MDVTDVSLSASAVNLLTFKITVSCITQQYYTTYSCKKTNKHSQNTTVPMSLISCCYGDEKARDVTQSSGILVLQMETKHKPQCKAACVPAVS